MVYYKETIIFKVPERANIFQGRGPTFSRGCGPNANFYRNLSNL